MTEEKEEYEEMRPDDVFVTGEERETMVPWEYLGTVRQAKVLHKELSWPTFAETCLDCTEEVKGTDKSKFNAKRYLIEIARKTIVAVNGQPFKPEDPYKWKHQFGIGLMDAGIIPKPQFGGGEAKNQSGDSTPKK